MALRGAIVVDTATCKGCSICLSNCAASVIALSGEVNTKGYHYAFMQNSESCTGCMNCAAVCPDSCITVYRIKI